MAWHAFSQHPSITSTHVLPANWSSVSLCKPPQERNAFHNDINPRHVLLQPPQQGARRKYMLIDYGGAACPRLADPAIVAEMGLDPDGMPEMLDVRASVLDPLCGSLDSLWAQHTLALLSQGSDLQSLVNTLILLAGGHLPWEAAANAGVLPAVGPVQTHDVGKIFRATI